MISLLGAGLLPMVAGAAGAADGADAAKDEVFILSYFRGNGETGVFLAASDDGFHFEPLNDDKPVFAPPKWPDQSLTRDPSILFHDGTFHMVWTSNWEGRVFGYASSGDLADWSEPTQVRPFPAELPEDDQPLNVWAPEIHRDPVRGDFFILFSSTTPRELEDGDSPIAHDLDHRSFVVRTKDGGKFSPARLFYDPGYSVIDPVVHPDPANERWVMVAKKELFREDGGKNLRLAFAPASEGKPLEFSDLGDPILGPGSSIRPGEQVEGPSLLRHDGRWLVYADAFTSKHYSCISSEDLEEWKDETDRLDMPPNLRHGTIFKAPRDEVAWLAGED